MTGEFGNTVRRFSARLLREGLVHVVASDAHDAVRRPPGLTAGFAALERELPGLGEQRAVADRGGPARDPRRRAAAAAPAAPPPRGPAAAARAQSLTIAMIALAITHSTISTCIQKRNGDTVPQG